MKKIYVMGVDVGSATSKCAIMQDGSELLAGTVIDMGVGSSGVEKAIAKTLEDTGLTMDDMSFIVATGYGRNNYEKADRSVSELSCHAKGAHFIFGGCKTIIDIGGQDAKGMKLDENGELKNFVMNEKCAAGTGRFLDVMAKILSVDISQLGEMDQEATGIIPISSTCTVFAESEVISSLAKNNNPKDIVKGIHKSVASRVAGLINRVGVEPKVVMTGGVSKNIGVVKALEKELGVDIETSPKSQLAGAIGACIFAYNYYLKEEGGNGNV